jgi:transcriptional regulator with XRE-family HTH domain
MKEVFRVEPAIGHVIRQARHAQQLTLEDVASLVGITAGALSHIESGRRLPNASNAARIAQVLGIPRETLLTMLDDEHSQRRRHTADTSTRQGPGGEPQFSLSAPGPADFSPRMPAYSERPIEDLFEPTSTSMPSRMARREAAMAGPRTPSVESMRTTARWSEDTTERLAALERLADSAASSIRTLRGMLADEDPDIRREARRLLAELDVRPTEE